MYLIKLVSSYRQMPRKGSIHINIHAFFIIHSANIHLSNMISQYLLLEQRDGHKTQSLLLWNLLW